MLYQRLLKKILQLCDNIDRVIVDNLYRLSIGSLTILILLIIGVALYLYPILSNDILTWAVILIFLTLIRLYSAYLYLHSTQRYSIGTWYALFVILALLTAFGFTILPLFFIPQLDLYYQLFIITITIGLVSGSITSLSSDLRLSIAYITILLVPLALSLVFNKDAPFNAILIMALVLYYVAQVMMILRHHKHECEFKELQQREDFLHNLFRESPVGILSFDSELKVVDCNQKLCELFEYDKKDIVGMQLHQLSDQRFVKVFEHTLDKGYKNYTGSYRTLGGKTHWIEAMVFSFSNRKNQTVGGVGIIEDKTTEHQAVKELEYLAEHDVLTGLLNRRGLSNYMKHLVLDPRNDLLFSLLFYIDLNHFKSINDTLGHAVGDELLLAVSRRLTDAFSSGSMFSRIGGDEFIAVLPYLSRSKEVAMRKAQEYAVVFKEIFKNPFAIKDMRLKIKASVGIVIIEPRHKESDELIRHANIAMHHAKKSKDAIAFYDPSLDQSQKELFALQHDLSYAIQKNQLKLFLQPIVSIADDRLLSAELLLRWEHPKSGLFLADSFISMAIKGGVIFEITWWIIDELCRYIVELKKEGLWSLEYISINVNAQQLTENGFGERFLDKLKSYGIDTKDIMIEITESSLIDNFEFTKAVISHLRSHGVRCAIDDFGIGYSSLSYLKKFSFNTLKIDKAFVQNIETNPQDLMLMRMILDIGRLFNYQIVIEGIEKQAQKELLCGLDPKLAYQGYLFSKPLEIGAFIEKYLKG